MRSQELIKSEITQQFIADPNIIQLYDLQPGLTYEDQFSVASFEDILFSQLSAALSLHEQIVEENAKNSRPHPVRWYKKQCLNYLDGLSLTWVEDQFFYYDTTNINNVDERRIIKQCSVLESNNGELVIKVAKEVNGQLQPLSTDELNRFKAYVRDIKAAGTRIRFINLPADTLKIALTVYVDINLIDLQTGRLLNTAEEVYPVKDAIQSYLSNLEFNGAFVKEFFRDQIQKAEGVKRPLIDLLQSQYLGFPFQNIEDWEVPNSGYYKADDVNVTIIYLKNDLVGNN